MLFGIHYVVGAIAVIAILLSLLSFGRSRDKAVLMLGAAVIVAGVGVLLVDVALHIAEQTHKFKGILYYPAGMMLLGLGIAIYAYTIYETVLHKRELAYAFTGLLILAIISFFIPFTHVFWHIFIGLIAIVSGAYAAYLLTRPEVGDAPGALISLAFVLLGIVELSAPLIKENLMAQYVGILIAALALALVGAVSAFVLAAERKA